MTVFAEGALRLHVSECAMCTFNRVTHSDVVGASSIAGFSVYVSDQKTVMTSRCMVLSCIWDLFYVYSM